MFEKSPAPRSVLITGASSGIGRALALHYAKGGVFLFISGRNEQRLAETASACRAQGAIVETALISVTDQTKMKEWIEDADAAHPIDLIIANAGISGGTGGVMEGEPIDQARHIFDVNLMGVINTIAPALPRFTARGKGQIAIISSLAGYRGFPGAPAYSASKGAVRFYGEALRGAVRKSGVKINVIMPGFVESRMTAANDFRMPFFMSAEKAAKIIAKGLSVNNGRIAFPLPTQFSAWLLSVLPDCIAQKILGELPAKGRVSD